jgi:hypothetical protein
MSWYQVPQQVKSVLSKILLCRTSALKGRVYECPGCRLRCPVYNSCTDRHCPQCSGARRGDWLEKTRELLLHGVNYFQIVFTLPDRFSSLILGNRRPLYDLLFRAAWQSLQEVLREQGKFYPAALMVLHTHNQQLGHHPHLHALVPGGGPSLEGKRWTTSRHPTHRNRRKPYLVDNALLGQRLREKFTDGVRRLVRAGKLSLEEDWAKLRERQELEAWLLEVTQSDWNVFIEGPPNGKSSPDQVLKYLAGYMTGEPISNRRIIRDENGCVTFWARSKNKAKGNSRRRFQLSGKEFVRRWSMHILPKGYTRSRCFGGYHGGKRNDYLNRCREFLMTAGHQPIKPPEGTEEISTEQTVPKCPRCDIEMNCIQNQPRPSWRDVFTRDVYADPAIYSPLHYGHDTGSAGFPPFPHEPDG